MKNHVLCIMILLLSCGKIMAANHHDDGPFDNGHDDEKGLFVGGAMTYWNNSREKSTSFQLQPECGWRFNETWATGVALSYGIEKKLEEGVNERNESFKIAPFLRYYYMHRGPFNLYLDGGFGYNVRLDGTGENKKNSSGFEVGLRPGVCVDLTKGFCLCVRIGFAGYRKNYFTGEEEGIGEDGFGLRLAPEEAMIGLEFEF